MEVGKKLTAYINGIDNRVYFDAVQAAPTSSQDLPDEAGDVRVVVLDATHPHSGHGIRHHSDSPGDGRHLEPIKDAVRPSLAREMSPIHRAFRLDPKR